MLEWDAVEAVRHVESTHVTELDKIIYGTKISGYLRSYSAYLRPQGCRRPGWAHDWGNTGTGDQVGRETLKK